MSNLKESKIIIKFLLINTNHLKINKLLTH